MVCAACGCPLPENGVCYNCLKNENDANRFGSRFRNHARLYQIWAKGQHTQNNRSRTGKAIQNPEQETKPAFTAGVCYSYQDEAACHTKKSLPANRKVSTRALLLPKKPLHGTALTHQRRGANRLLKAVYQQPVFISDILRQEGFSDQRIRGVQNQVALYLQKLVAAWCRQWNNDLLSWRIVMVAVYFSFGGEAPRRTTYLAQWINRPVKNVNHNLQGAISQLRRSDRKRRIEKLIVETALNLSPELRRRAGAR